MSTTVYFSLGTNLGDKEQNLRTAIQQLEQRVGHVLALSSFHVTEPWGFTSCHTFLNAACSVQTDLEVMEVLRVTQQIEREMGRTLKSVDGTYHDRLIDIDLLLCYDADGRSITLQTPELVLPHPLMYQRDFVMRPLREILPIQAER